VISHRYRCIFIHIPKCAGTSIEAALGHLEGHSGRGGQDHRSLRMIEPLGPRQLAYALRSPGNVRELVRRLRYRYLPQTNPRNKLTVTPEQYASYFKFTVVRNPWARAYSWYRNVMADQVHQRTLGVEPGIPLRHFLRRFLGRGMLRPQTYWIRDFQGRIPMDFIGRFEKLQEHWREICRRIGIEPPELPHLVRTGGDYREAYDEESRELVASFYSEEIALFGYTFES